MPSRSERGPCVERVVFDNCRSGFHTQKQTYNHMDDGLGLDLGQTWVGLEMDSACVRDCLDMGCECIRDGLRC